MVILQILSEPSVAIEAAFASADDNYNATVATKFVIMWALVAKDLTSLERDVAPMVIGPDGNMMVAWDDPFYLGLVEPGSDANLSYIDRARQLIENDKQLEEQFFEMTKEG